MTERESWVEVEGTVTSCRYQFRALSALTFGMQTGEKFRITFDYLAEGQRYSDEFQSPTAIAQDEQISLSYNPLFPQQNSRGIRQPTDPPARVPLLVIGLCGSVLLSLIWLAVLRGCA